MLGGVNNRYASTTFKYYSLSSQNDWKLVMSDIVFNGSSYKNSSNLAAIIDTGTSVIIGPAATV